LISKAQKWINLIKYQKGTMVIRILNNKGSKTLRVYVFDRDQGFSEHTAPFDTFVPGS
jgi:hypothetical protein